MLAAFQRSPDFIALLKVLPWQNLSYVDHVMSFVFEMVTFVFDLVITSAKISQEDLHLSLMENYFGDASNMVMEVLCFYLLFNMVK